MVHRGRLASNITKNKKDDFNSCIAEKAKTADDEICNKKIGEPAPKTKQIKKSTTKASFKGTTLPLFDHSISQTVVRLERSRFIKTKNHPSIKAIDTSSGGKSKCLSPIRVGLRSSSLESHTSTASNNNNVKAEKKTNNIKRVKATDPTESSPKQSVDEKHKNAQTKLPKQLPLSFICSLPLIRLSGILEKIKINKTKYLTGVKEDTYFEDNSNIDNNLSNQCKTLCLYCDKRMSTVRLRTRHIERFHTISKKRRSSSRNPVTPSSQDSSSAPLTPLLSTANLFFNGCSFCCKSPKLQAVAFENDLSALFFHLVDVHSDKYFGCKVCTIRYQTAAKLSDHVQRTHLSSHKNSNCADFDVYCTSIATEEDHIGNGVSKSTPTKTRRQIKQIETLVLSSSTTQVASSSAAINRNGGMFSNDEPILSRLGLTQNRLPRGRRRIRSRRLTNVDSVKSETSMITVKTRSKLGRFNTSNESVETIFRTPTNTRIEPLSCTFDEDFYEKVFNNVRTNLSCHLDGKLGCELDSNRPQSPPALMPTIRSTVFKNPQVLESEVHTATSLTALTAFPTLLTAEQYGCDFSTAKIKRPITRHSWKWKWDSVKKYKYVNEGGKIVKKIKQPMLGLRDLSKLDMWTQLTMRQNHEVVRKQSDKTNSQCLLEYTDKSREEKQRQVDQLNTILDSRRLPQIILEQNEQTIIKFEITGEVFRCLVGDVSMIACPEDEEPSTSMTSSRIIPPNLNLTPVRSVHENVCQTVVLSGEWARPRCYVCFGCGARFDKLKELEEHKMFRHPHVFSTHYEIVGRELIEGNLYKHFFIPLKALSRHKEYAQRILVNKKTEFNLSKSSSNSANEEESLDSLHSVTASFTTISSSKLSDDCDTDTKTVTENPSPFAEPSLAHLSKDNVERLAAAINSSIECTKCNKNCHGMLELYRHMLDCSGDYAWMLAKKKKYRYFGTRKRRQFNKQNISSLHLHRRKVKISKDENESHETTKKKTINMSPLTPRPRASDADSIRKMLENLPPKRVCREIIPNATKPRTRKFKAITSGRKLLTNSTNKCKASKAVLSTISKKILRNHKLRAINEKDQITQNKKKLETNRRSTRFKSRVISKKNVHSKNNKLYKKTETRSGGTVRKKEASTERFVKKMNKNLLGEQSDNSILDENVLKSTEDKKKPSRTLAVRKLIFDKETESAFSENIISQSKSPVKIRFNADERIENVCKIEKTDLSLNGKYQIPTITIETNYDLKNLNDANINEDFSLRSEGSMDNLHEQSELSASTEDLNRLNASFSHDEISPKTKRRSKKISDCIAMLTGKIQEKLGKPFLECKDNQNSDSGGADNSIKTKTVIASFETKNTKLPKRKAFTRRIVQCDQLSVANVDLVSPGTEQQSIKVAEILLPTDTPSEQTKPKKSSKKEIPLQLVQLKETLTKEPSLFDTSVKQSLSDKPILHESLVEMPNLLSEKALLNDTLSNFETLLETKLKRPMLSNKPFNYKPLSNPSLSSKNLLKIHSEEHPHKDISKKKQPFNNVLATGISLESLKQCSFTDSTNLAHSAIELSIRKELKIKKVTSAHTQNKIIFGNLQRTTFNTDFPESQDPTPEPNHFNSADTIRVPSIKPMLAPQLSMPKCIPVQQQVTAPRGMITKRRQTIPGAPNDFLYAMNSLCCAKTYSNLPLEIDVPLDLSKKTKRTSTKGNDNATKLLAPVNFPQISVKTNDVLMPSVPYQPVLSQTQIIPILCDSLSPKVPEVSLQSPPFIFPGDVITIPVTTTPLKKASNNKKTDIVTNTTAPFLSLSFKSPPPKKNSRKANSQLEADISKPNLKISAENMESNTEITLPIPTYRKTAVKEKDTQIKSNKGSSAEAINDPIKTSLALEELNSILLVNIFLSSDKEVNNQPQTTAAPSMSDLTKPEAVVQNLIPKVDTNEKNWPIKQNENNIQITPKKGSPSLKSILKTDQATKTVDSIGKNINESEPSPEAQKSLPTRRSRRNKIIDQTELKKPAMTNAALPISALKEVEEIAASFLTDDELENENNDLPKSKQLYREDSKVSETTPKPTIKPNNQPNSVNEIVDNKNPEQISQPNDGKIKLAEVNEISSVTINKETETTTIKQSSGKKPRKRRKNELASIVADQLMESFKETDKSRIDDLKRLEELAYEKSEDLLLTGMRLMPSTKRKNVLENKKEAIADLESKAVSSVKESKKQKAELPKEKLSRGQKDYTTPNTNTEIVKEKYFIVQKSAVEIYKDPKDGQQIDTNLKNQVEPKTTIKKPQLIDFGNYRSNSVDSWSIRGSKQLFPELGLPLNDKFPIGDSLIVSQKDKKNKKKQIKRRDKRIDIENINKLRTGLESFTFRKNVCNVNDISEVTSVNGTPENSNSAIGLFSSTPTQPNSQGSTVNNKDISPFDRFNNVKTNSSILRPSILAASFDTFATNNENLKQVADRKSSISSRDPRLNKNIHTEEEVNVPLETTSRLATLRTRRKSLADATRPTYNSRLNSRSMSSKLFNAGSHRNSLAFDDDEDDNYLTAIAKKVNDKIMSAEDKDFNLANDGFELVNSFLGQDDPFGRPSTSMSVRSAPNLNEDRSNMDTMDATNTDLIDMDVDDDMSVYTTFSQDTTRSKRGRRKRRRRSVLLTRKPKKTNINMLNSMETFACLLCNKKFAKVTSLNKHHLTIAHVSKVSEQEYLNAARKQEEKEKEASANPKQYINGIQNIRLVENNVSETHEENAVEKMQKPYHAKVPLIPPNSILNQSGIEPISSPEQNYERYSTKTSSRLTLNPDERLFYECCNILKGSETPLVERTYAIVPPTTYAYDLQVKLLTPKSPNERFSQTNQSVVETNGKRETGKYPRFDVNQFSDISSDSNPACCQPRPVLQVNHAQKHVLSVTKDEAVFPNKDGRDDASRNNLSGESSIMQTACIASSIQIPTPVTARTFVNQPSQIGTYLHGVNNSAATTQKQNFISPLHSASSQSSTVTTTTCRLKTKAAMKGYDNLKVSIPTIGLDMEHALERSPRPGCRLTTLADIALGNETPLTTFTPSMHIHTDQKSKSFTPIKKKDNAPVKEPLLIISVSDTESCLPIISSLPKKTKSIIPKDIYEFDDSENAPISKAMHSPFKMAEDTNGGSKKMIIIPDRPFKNIGMEEKEGIQFQKPDTPAINDENTTSTVTYSDRDDFVYGSMCGDDDDNDIDIDDNKEPHMNSDDSSNSSAFTAKTFENKSLIMGRIFKNAKTKHTFCVEKSVLPTPEPPKQIPKQELDRLFDTLRGMNENRETAISASKEVRQENVQHSFRKRENHSAKRKTTDIEKTSKNRTTKTNKPNKKATKKYEQHTSKELSQLHAELGMSPAEIAELIGEGQRKSQRRCAVNRPKKIVEIWSSDEFEEFLSTKDIIALIEEKEQMTKKKRKSTTGKKFNPTSVLSKNWKKDTDVHSFAQLEYKKTNNSLAPPQKSLKNETRAAQVTSEAKNNKTIKGKQKHSNVIDNVTNATSPALKVTAKAPKEPKPSLSGNNSIEAIQNDSSPFKKPTQKNIISKIAADDSESDFEIELNQRKKTSGPVRNRRKTISGNLENDARSSSKKITRKSKGISPNKHISQNNKTSLPLPADSAQVRPQARRKRIASEMLYYWSSSSDEEFGRIESPNDDEHHIDESENYQQHGWIVGDSHKKLVTLLAIAKGNKKVDDCGVKEINSKKKS